MTEEPLRKKVKTVHNPSESQVVLHLDRTIDDNCLFPLLRKKINKHTVLRSVVDFQLCSKFSIGNIAARGIYFCQSTQQLLACEHQSIHFIRDEQQVSVIRNIPCTVICVCTQHVMGQDFLFVGGSKSDQGYVFKLHMPEKKETEWKDLVIWENDKLGDFIYDMAPNPKTGELFVCDWAKNKIEILEPQTGKIRKTLTEQSPMALVFNEKGDLLIGAQKDIRKREKGGTGKSKQIANTTFNVKSMVYNPNSKQILVGLSDYPGQTIGIYNESSGFLAGFDPESNEIIPFKSFRDYTNHAEGKKICFNSVKNEIYTLFKNQICVIQYECERVRMDWLLSRKVCDQVERLGGQLPSTIPKRKGEIIEYFSQTISCFSDIKWPNTIFSIGSKAVTHESDSHTYPLYAREWLNANPGAQIIGYSSCRKISPNRKCCVAALKGGLDQDFDVAVIQYNGYIAEKQQYSSESEEDEMSDEEVDFDDIEESIMPLSVYLSKLEPITEVDIEIGVEGSFIVHWEKIVQKLQSLHAINEAGTLDPIKLLKAYQRLDESQELLPLILSHTYEDRELVDGKIYRSRDLLVMISDLCSKLSRYYTTLYSVDMDKKRSSEY